MMALQDARLRLYEDETILHLPLPKLVIGALSKPDDLGWRWFQCTNTLQILLPPDISIRYNIFLKKERKLIQVPSSHTTVQHYNQARKEFVDQCLNSMPEYPVRGISPSIHRYALEAGFRCWIIDAITTGEESLADSRHMSTFDAYLVPRSQLGLLGLANEWGRSWVRLTENTQVLLPADTASQYHAFLRTFVLSDTRRADVGWEAIIVNFTGACMEKANYLGIYKGDRLYVLERDMSSPALASLAGALRTHYREVAERGWLYARSVSNSLRDHHTKYSSIPILGRHRRCLKLKFALEPLAEVQEDVIAPDDTDGLQWGSKLSLQFSVTTTILGPLTSTENGSERDTKGASLVNLRRTAKLLSYRIPAKFCGRLITLVARTV